MTQHLDSATMPEFFGKRYNSRALRIAGAVRIAGAAFSEWGRGDGL